MQTDKPTLTDEQIDAILGAAYRKLVLETGYNGGMGGETWDRAAARAIEAAASSLPPPGGEPNNEWKEAMLDKLAITCGDAPIGTPPAEILDQVIRWHVAVATDPAVCEEAARRHSAEVALAALGWTWDREQWQPTSPIPAHQGEPTDDELLEAARDVRAIYEDGVTVLTQDEVVSILRAVARKFPAHQGEDAKDALASGFDGSRVRPGPNHSTIELWYDSEAQANAARKAIISLIDSASPTPAEGATGAGGGRDTSGVPLRQYFHRTTECTAIAPTHADCICWHNPGEGPLAGREDLAPAWRNAPAGVETDRGGER